jgi:hypothetical protein
MRNNNRYSTRVLNDAQMVAGLLEAQLRPDLPLLFPPQLKRLLQGMWCQARHGLTSSIDSPRTRACIHSFIHSCMHACMRRCC